MSTAILGVAENYSFFLCGPVHCCRLLHLHGPLNSMEALVFFCHGKNYFLPGQWKKTVKKR